MDLWQIERPQSENSVLNKSIVSLEIHFFATITTGYPIHNKMVGTKHCPFYIIQRPRYKSEVSRTIYINIYISPISVI